MMRLPNGSYLQPMFMFIAALAGLILAAAPIQADASFLDQLPEEVASVFENTVLPEVSAGHVVDLDANGTREVVFLSQATVVAGEDEHMEFQSMLMIFEEISVDGDWFPYRLAVMKSLSGDLPRPAHLAVKDMGGDSRPELVWLQGGPDEEGRYREAALFEYRPDVDGGLATVGIYSTNHGWVRIYDLDQDGASEVVAFSKQNGKTVCDDLFFHTGGGWSSLVSLVHQLGSPDINSYRARKNLPPGGNVNRDVLLAVKSDLNYSPVEVSLPATPSLQY